MFRPVNNAEFVGGSTINESDNENTIIVQLSDVDLNPEVLTGATVTWGLANNRGRIFDNRPVTVLTGGKVSFKISAADKIGWGMFYVQIKVVRSSTTEIFPADINQLMLKVTPSLQNLAHFPTSFASLETVTATYNNKLEAFKTEMIDRFNSFEGSQGVGLVYSWNGDRLGVRREDQTEFVYSPSLRGPQGLQGPAGLKGDTGATGNQGIQGIPGPKGDKGDKGDTGPQGLPGQDGADGTGVEILGSFTSTAQLPASGNPGDAYLINGNLYIWDSITNTYKDAGTIQGPRGEQGPQGIQGPQGERGLQGIQGETGPAGADGAQGIQGPIGLTGPKGDKGDTGERGLQGIQGPTGLTGAKGDKGDPGIQGIQGVPGVKGDKGDQGIQGIQGPKGDKGDTGAPGQNATLFIENRTSDPTAPVVGQIWIRTDL